MFGLKTSNIRVVYGLSLCDYMIYYDQQYSGLKNQQYSGCLCCVFVCARDYDSNIRVENQQYAGCLWFVLV